MTIPIMITATPVPPARHIDNLDHHDLPGFPKISNPLQGDDPS